MSDTGQQHAVGWAHWWLPMPRPWRFLKMDGGYRRGYLVLGDDDRPRLEMAWVWVSRRRLNVTRTIRRHLLRQVPRRERAGAAGRLETRHNSAFDEVVALKEDGRTRYVGYCARTHRMLHWVYHHGTPEENRNYSKQCLPEWRDQPLDAPSQWRFFDVAFSAPPRFQLHYGTLNLGDMEVILHDSLSWGTRGRLIVRHVYPARLALRRRPLKDWLMELFHKRRGPYRKQGKKNAEPSAFPHPHAPGLHIAALLQILLLLPLRPLVFRLPVRAEASLHHIAHLDKLIYIQASGRRAAIRDARTCILDSLPR